MFRFFALVWNPGDPGQVAAAKLISTRLASRASDMQCALSTESCAVYCADVRAKANEIYPLANGRGVVVGKLFAKDTACVPPPPTALSLHDSQQIANTGGQHLVERYWGRYVAFWQDATATHVLRDPTGTFPCYETSFRSVKIFFSWLEDCRGLGLLTFSLNWSYVAAILPLVIISSRTTGLQEVTQLYPGERKSITPHGSTTTLVWNPGHFATHGVLVDPAAAAAKLRESVRHTAHCWASCYDSILIRMSGGLDSTIALSGVRDMPSRPKITGLVHYRPNTRGDERPWARMAAEWAGCELVEVESSGAVELEPLTRMHAMPEPYSCTPYTQNDGVERRVAAAHGATGVFGGGGGDQLFYNARIALAASDVAQTYGLSRALLTAAHNAARLERTSVWRVLRNARQDAITRRRWKTYADAGTVWQLLSPGVAETAREDPHYNNHPWLAAAAQAGAPIGKQWHVDSLSIPASYYSPRGQQTDPEYVHPILSQPVIETALSIPIWILSQGGWDRALARNAFKGDIPLAIATRRSKGILDDHLEKTLYRNSDFVREMLLDGLLVRNGYLDRQRLEAVLGWETTCANVPQSEIYHYLSTESWARSWTVEAVKLAA